MHKKIVHELVIQPQQIATKQNGAYFYGIYSNTLYTAQQCYQETW